MGRQNVVPFFFRLYLNLQASASPKKIGESMPSHEDNPTERRSYDDALYKHLCQHRFCVGSIALDSPEENGFIGTNNNTKRI
jgi:hypothetical protein